MQAGVILSDYASLMVEILKDNARPEDGEVYAAMDMARATLVGQIAHATESGTGKAIQPAPVYGRTRKPRLNARLLAFAFYQRLQHRFEGDLSFSRAGVAVLELDPAVVEAIQHPNSGCGVLHALRLE